ncbi:hypothetical protein MFIFM68171_03646 [Madurella fahalii]|uniref:Uncharacterized protein n=1 Tax=Madurella fahalii TaxID=1157608 RepID=A0ABQ0G6T1_9PEZI
MTASWDPEQLLDIRGRAMIKGGIQCHGRNGGHGSRCGWTKGGREDEMPDVRDAEKLLDSMARKPMWDVTAQELQHLARLCLCRDHHMNQMQMDKVTDKGAGLVQRAMASYSPSSATNLNPDLARVAAPVAAPVEIHQFIGTEWLGANWQTALSAQVGSTASSQGSQSTNAGQHQHADAPTGFISSRTPPSRERTDTELAAALARVSALQNLNNDPREKEQCLLALDLEHSRYKERTEGELDTTRTQLSALQLENENLRRKEHRLNTLNAEYSTFREHTKAELAATQNQLSTLQLEMADRLKALDSQFSTLKGRMKAQLSAANDKLSQSLAENEMLKKEKNREPETLERRRSALEKKERELEFVLQAKDDELQTLRKHPLHHSKIDTTNFPFLLRN